MGVIQLAARGSMQGGVRLRRRRRGHVVVGRGGRVTYCAASLRALLSRFRSLPRVALAIIQFVDFGEFQLKSYCYLVL